MPLKRMKRIPRPLLDNSNDGKKQFQEGIYIPLSPGEEMKIFSEVAKKNAEQLAAAPVELKVRNMNIVSNLENLCRQNGSEKFDEISTGSWGITSVPEDNRFDFSIETKCFLENDAKSFVEKMRPEIEKLAIKNGFKYICFEKPKINSWHYQYVKVMCRKKLSAIEEKHYNYKKLNTEKKIKKSNGVKM